MTQMNRAFVETIIREEIKSGIEKNNFLLKVGAIWDGIVKSKGGKRGAHADAKAK